MNYNDDCWEWQDFHKMPTQEKYDLVEARLEWLVITGLAVKSQSADGVSVENDFEAMERLRDYLARKLVDEAGQWRVQNRIKRGWWWF